MALKIRHNAVLGYFVETTAKAAEPLQPPLNATFIHRQTLANQVRFTTVELAELDARIAQAGRAGLAIEVATFEAWREAAALREPRDPGRRRGRRLPRRRQRPWPNGPTTSARPARWSTAPPPSRRRPPATRWSRPR